MVSVEITFNKLCNQLKKKLHKTLSFLLINISNHYMRKYVSKYTDYNFLCKNIKYT